ncbi:MAG: hypothetical protein K1X94_33425 [Sandaracinaceae bacterium]|nr:hypothetical protein [Sandaracinaceae bacterium]
MLSVQKSWLVAVLTLSIAGCSCTAPPAADAGGRDVGRPDASTSDAPLDDASVPTDAAPVDGGTVDGGTVDGGAVDGGAVHGGAVDAGRVDAGAADAGTVDADAVDAGGRSDCAGVVGELATEGESRIVYSVGATGALPIFGLYSAVPLWNGRYETVDILERPFAWSITAPPASSMLRVPVGNLVLLDGGYRSVSDDGTLGAPAIDARLEALWPLGLRWQGSEVVSPWLLISRLEPGRLVVSHGTTDAITAVDTLPLTEPVDSRGILIAEAIPDGVIVIQDRRFWRFPFADLGHPFETTAPPGASWPTGGEIVTDAWDAANGRWVVVAFASATDHHHLIVYYVDPISGVVTSEAPLFTGREAFCQLVPTSTGVAFVCAAGRADHPGGNAVEPFLDIQIAFADPDLGPFASVFPPMPGAYDTRAIPSAAWDESLGGVVVVESLTGRGSRFPTDRNSLTRWRCVSSAD